MSRRILFGAGLCMVLALSACSSDDPTTPGDPVPEPYLGDLEAEVNPTNALALRVAFVAENVDGVRAIARVAGEVVETTPVQDPARRELDVFALPAASGIEIILEAYAGDDTLTTEPVTATTGSLPDALAAVRITTTGDAGPGYTLVGVQPTPSPGYVIAMDSSGAIRWYCAVDGFEARDFGWKSNGNWVAFVGNTRGWEPTYGYYVEFTPGGDPVGRYQAPVPYYTDGHELLLTDTDGGMPAAHFFSYDIRRTDLTPIGGNPDVLLAGHQILRMRGGVVEFFWNAWDHFVLEDWIEAPDALKQNDQADFDHPNSLAIDAEGHYIASFRHMAELTRIHSRTGEILWRLGGRNNQFTFPNDPMGGFNGQHTARVMEDGNILLYDNGLRHEPPESRMVEYRLDLETMTAIRVAEFRHDPPIFTPTRGSTQRLSEGNTLIGWSSAGIITEVEPRTGALWEAVLERSGGEPLDFYRTERIATLYGYRAP